MINRRILQDYGVWSLTAHTMHHSTGYLGARRFSRHAAIPLILAIGLSLAACGGAGAGDTGFTTGVGPGGGNSSPVLAVETTSVPGGSVGASYSSTQLVASGATGSVVWGVIGGTLPPGLTITSDGMLFGTPSATGFYAFTVEASDGIGEAAQMLGVSVETFGAYTGSGLQFGEAWSGKEVTLNFSGASGAPQVSLLQNGSGGSVIQINESAGTITYMPGQVFASSVNDLIRITDPASGSHIDIPLVVRANPHANHIARFGATDVWKVDFTSKTGAHAYASDWHECLARLGLRNPASTNVTGTETDRLSDMVCRTVVLRNLNQFFLRSTNGEGGVQGLSISFPYEDLTGYAAPAAGGYVAGQPFVYNVMSLNSIATYGILGMAYLDAANNAQIEHNAPGGPVGQLGVFVNRITDYVDSSYGLYTGELSTTPVNANDMDALKALLFESGNSGGRYGTLEYAINALARSVGAVTAHEIGHSLGLVHTNPTMAGSLMNYSTAIAPGATYAFLPADISRLQAALPGPGRGSSQLQLLKVGTGMPEGGVTVCGK